MIKKHISLACMILTGLAACNERKEIKTRSHTYDAQLLKDHGIKYVELKSEGGSAEVMVVPSWQGRVVTTFAAGDEGNNYGWINYRFIEVGRQSDRPNPVGGEERLWLGPEGGSYPLYFTNGKKQVYDNWEVPVVIDIETFDVVESNDTVIQFKKSTLVRNASRIASNLDINRKISLLFKTSTEQRSGTTFPTDAELVAYESLNKITNTDKGAWTKKNGLISIRVLGHFNPTPTTTVSIPFRENAEDRAVNDKYFGEIPADRSKTKDGILYFKTDGKLRSRLGVPLTCSKGSCCSYDSGEKVLTILRCNIPEKPGAYLNGRWGKQSAPSARDTLNAYNDGPVEGGSVMGLFYKIEVSSSNAELAVNESFLHKQETFHTQVEEAILDPTVERPFGINLETVKSQSRQLCNRRVFPGKESLSGKLHQSP